MGVERGNRLIPSIAKCASVARNRLLVGTDLSIDTNVVFFFLPAFLLSFVYFSFIWHGLVA